MSCFLYTCLCHCHWSSFHNSPLIISHFPLTLNNLRMSVLNCSYNDSFSGIMGLELSNLVLEMNLNSKKNGVTICCYVAFNLRH